MNLKQYLADDDPSKWYRLSSGEMETLLEEALEENENLRAALTDLLNDLRERADLHEDGCRVLACGNGVLYQAEKALKGEE